jgi:flagellum-specific ATP synthase
MSVASPMPTDPNAVRHYVPFPRIDLSTHLRAIRTCDTMRYNGKVQQVVGVTIESQGPSCQVGDLCHVVTRQGREIPAEVVGFRDARVVLMPLSHTRGIEAGCDVVATGRTVQVPVGPALLGRVLDALGNPLDDRDPPECDHFYPVAADPPPALSRQRIAEPLELGVRALDGTLTVGKGQRIGIFSGSGVGKSTLLGMIARNTSAQVNVIGLVGERGREVREFIEKDLGEEGLARSVVICATSDTPAVMRLKAAMAATSVAEYFRDQGIDVILMMDSVTRVAMAQREIGLAVGEPPATRGYPPSVFAMLPQLLERSGCSARGAITGIYTVLVDGDDMTEPIADQVRSILDGHVVLTRELADRNHFPAVDVLRSISRVMPDIVEREHRECAGRLRDVLATYREAEDLINIGAYVPGSNPSIDYARSMIDRVRSYLVQGIDEASTLPEAIDGLLGLLGDGGYSDGALETDDILGLSHGERGSR